MPATSYTDPQSIHNPATNTAPPASWGDTVRDDLEYLYKGRLYVCTAATRPSGATKGDTIYETDTGKVLVYYGATTGWQYTWNRPWGMIATAQATSNQTGISTEADVTSVTVTFTAVANRYYFITSNGRVTQQTSTGVNELKITDGSNNLKGKSSVSLTSGSAYQHTCVALQTPSAGSITYKARLSTTAGTVDTTAASTQPFIIIVQDMGPNGTVPSA